MDIYFAQAIINGVSIGFGYALIAIGFTLIFGVLNAVNFAHGEIYTLGAFAALIIILMFAPPIIVLILLVAIVGVLSGWGLERIAFRPFRRSRDEATLKSRAMREATLMSSLAMGIIAREALTLYFGGEAQSIPQDYLLNQPIELGGLVLANGDLVILGSAVAMLIFLQVLLYRTNVGREIRAVADDFLGALYVGVDANKVIVRTFMIGSAFGAIAGLLVGLYYGQIFPFMGFTPMLKAFIAMLMGGLNNIFGAVVCALIIGLSESLLANALPSHQQWVDVVPHVYLLLTLLFFPSGLFGKRSERM
ncbi:branched-chain amino acid ABC transporter permease [Rhodoligotrophos ferricapiens]|uniref:branched-chain amino acid ABC transporter permease n=1 Tax=Rhodoligotrophos ferricapiens TaxID=3069264 RepID=UPI00315C7B9A